MPTKIDSHYGEGGFPDTKPVEINAADGVRLLVLLGDDGAETDPAWLANQVQQIGDQFYRGWKRGAGKHSRAEARKGLEDLAACGRVDYAMLSGLNERAFDALNNTLLTQKPRPVADGKFIIDSLMRDEIEETAIRKAIDDTIAGFKAQKGADTEGEIPFAVEELCSLYEEMTGKPATHSSKGEFLKYHAEPTSKAGQFVAAAFRQFFPEIRDTQLSNGMRSFIKYSNKHRKVAAA